MYHKFISAPGGLIWFLLFIQTSVLCGQGDSKVEPSLVSPYTTLRTHLYFLQPENYDPSKSALTIPATDPVIAEKRAIQLKQILDGKGLYVRMNMISQDADYTDSAAMAHIYTPFPKQLPLVYLEKTDGLWHYAQETIDAVPKMHRRLYPLGADLLSRRMPDTLRVQVAGLALWQYLGILTLVLSLWIFHLMLSRLFRPIVRLIAGKVKNLGYASPADIVKTAQLASLLLVFFAFAIIFPVLQLPIRMSQFLSVGLSIASAVLWTLLGLTILRIVVSRIRVITSVTDSKMDDQLLPIIHKLVQIAIVVAAVVYILSRLSVNVTALIAGLSIGALALALAAQDTVKNLIGSAMIFIDKPFQIGDLINVDGKEGNVIEVGFRSTRIRANDTSILAIPNGTIANINIINLGVRESRMMNILLGVTYSTTPDQIQAFTAELKKLIAEHPKIDKENYYVHLRDMGDSALKIMFRCYIPTADFAEELQIKEEIYLEILRIAERLSIHFAFPSTSVYIEKSAD